MELIKIVNGSPVPYSFDQFKRDNPRTNFVNGLTPALMAENGIYRVIPEPTPVITFNQKVEPNPNVYVDTDGNYRRGWTVTEKSPRELEEDRKGLTLTFAQLLIGLVTLGWITEAEGDDWLEGRIPQAARMLIQTLPPQQRFAAKARAARPSVILRSEPLLQMLAQANGHTDADLDQFFLTFSEV